MIRKFVPIAALAALCLHAPSAEAGINRAWVSGHGSDAAGCGAPTAPCRTFQYVISNVINAGGEIDVMDPAGYGAMTIPFSLSIINDGVGVAGVQATSGNAITINAGATDEVILRGLTIEGLNTASNGIQINAGLTVDLANSTLSGFTQNAINFSPNNGNGVFAVLSVSDSTIHGGAAVALNMKPTGGTLAQFDVHNSNLGDSNKPIVSIDSSAETGGYLLGSISNCLLHNTSATAVVVNAPSSGDSVSLMINNSTITLDGNALEADGSNAAIGLNASTFSGIGAIATTSSGGSIVTFGNNGMYFYTTLGPLTSAGLH